MRTMSDIMWSKNRQNWHCYKLFIWLYPSKDSFCRDWKSKFKKLHVKSESCDLQISLETLCCTNLNNIIVMSWKNILFFVFDNSSIVWCFVFTFLIESAKLKSKYNHYYISTRGHEKLRLEIDSISTENSAKVQEVVFSSTESPEDSLYIWDVFSKGEALIQKKA